MLAAIDEGEIRAIEEVMGRRAHEDLAGPRECRHSGRRVDGQTTGLTAGDPDFSGMEPSPDRDPEVSHSR
jgi:hypothetical protein